MIHYPYLPFYYQLMKLTAQNIDAVKSATQSIDLYYVDYNDKLDTEELQKIMDTWYASEDILDNWETNDHSIAIQTMEELGLDTDDDEMIEQVRDIIIDNCSNNPIPQLIKNAGPQPVRLSAYSNFEGIQSAYSIWQSGFEYSDGLKQIIDILKINPAALKKALLEKGYKTLGAFPNLKARDTQAYIPLADFINELENITTDCNLLTLVGLADIRDFYTDEKQKNKIVTFPKGNSLGLFDGACGGGSLIECTLLRDFTVDISKLHGPTKYDSWSLSIDSQESGYSIDETYGVTREFWGSEISHK